MLERARRKDTEIEWIEGDLLELPFEEGSFDAATVGFGCSATSPTSGRGSPSCGGCCARAGGSAFSRSPGHAGRVDSSTGSGSTS
jgi:hypothetical protein